MLQLALLALAGALGTLSRYWLGGLLHIWLGMHFPYGTLAVNVLGCALMGFLGLLAGFNVLANLAGGFGGLLLGLSGARLLL